MCMLDWLVGWSSDGHTSSTFAVSSLLNDNANELLSVISNYASTTGFCVCHNSVFFQSDKHNLQFMVSVVFDVA